MKAVHAVMFDDVHTSNTGNGRSRCEVNKHDFFSTLLDNGIGRLRRRRINDLQVNVGKLCNQACNHCHVDAGPKRSEIMSWETMRKIVDWSNSNCIENIDITGGAPEMNPNFRRFVESCLNCNMKVTSRCNLTVLFEPGQEDLAAWYTDNQVTLICSLPCYTQENLEAQRGKGVFDKSIRALQLLNEFGYATNSDLKLDLVYNPGGAFLPPDQEQLEQTYKMRLYNDFGVRFNSLYTLANLPVSRFRHYLEKNGEYGAYMDLLFENFNVDTVDALMCRHLLSIDWLGKVYDCDFNQMLEINAGGKETRYLWDIDAKTIANDFIAVDSHCFGCTAGSGSSCSGSLI